MDRLNKQCQYFNDKERKRLEAKVKDSSSGLPEMNSDEIKLSCLENNGYETPELNDKLYLHFRGFKKIENLEKYTACKSIWLDSNGFDKIENLDQMTELRCLYLSKNLIGTISGLENLKCLTILDLSNNRLTMLSNLSCCPILQTLNVAYNYLASREAIEHLKECPALQNVDVTNNRLPADESILDVLKEVPSLVALSINGNEFTKIASFRKKMVVALPKLGYLDRPVDPQERLFAKAYLEGGAAAETEARNRWKEEQDKKRVDEMNEFRNWQREKLRARELAKEQGACAIEEMSQEEVDRRAAERRKAEEDEKKLLSIGIDKLAKAYWKMDAAGNGDLDSAMEQVLQQSEEDAPELESEEVVHQRAEVVEEREIWPLSDDNAPPPVTTHRIPIVEVSEDENAAVEDPVAVQNEAVEEEKASERERERAEEKREQALRDQRVQESFEIYKRQRELEKAGQLAPAYRQSCTWSDCLPLPGSEPTAAAPAAPEAQEKAAKPLYWTELMDIELAKFVQKCVFDFDDISTHMAAMARDGQFGKSFGDSEVLTSDECRNRWAQLDAAQWSTVGPSTSALDTVFKVFIKPSVLGAGHGAQPNFQALSSIASGSKPNYLSPPVSFPSVNDYAEEDQSDLELD